jgi:hypothetical protein
VQGIKKGEAFGVMLNTLPAKAKFSAEHVGSAALVFSMYVPCFDVSYFPLLISRAADP